MLIKFFLVTFGLLSILYITDIILCAKLTKAQKEENELLRSNYNKLCDICNLKFNIEDDGK